MRRPISPRRPDGLTERQWEIFRYLYEHARDRGYQPSIRGVMAEFGLGSPNGVVVTLRLIARKGWIDLGATRARSIHFLRRPDGSPFSGFADKESHDGIAVADEGPPAS